MKIWENVPVSEMTTMRLGGEARYVIDIDSLETLYEAHKFAEDYGLPIFVLGRGANTIGKDEGFSGVIFRNKLRGIEILREEGDELIVRGMSGGDWDGFVEFVTKKGYTGIEALSLIPGTVGAAPVQNIGAYGQEISEVVSEVVAYDFKTKKIRHFSKEECRFSYRHSIFNSGETAGRYFILEVVVRLTKGRMDRPFYRSVERYIEERGVIDFSPMGMREIVMAIRREKLPDPEVFASAGSFFKNVYLNNQEADDAEARGISVWRDLETGENKVSAGWLIEKSGLKGEEFFGFRISEKAALILINEKGNSYKDLARARERIIETVFSKFGYRLEQEPVLLEVGGKK